jgi:hypothetical protein
MKRLRVREGHCLRHTLEAGTGELNPGCPVAKCPLRDRGGTHRAGHRPEGGEPVHGVGRVPAPGAAARVLTALQHELLALEAGVLEAQPPAGRDRAGTGVTAPT